MLRSWLAVCLVLVLTMTACAKSDVPPKLEMPGIGRLSGVQMSIPAEYKLFPAEYEGDEIWPRPPKRHAPGRMCRWSSSLLLHLPDFAPRTKDNEAGWSGKNGHDAQTTSGFKWV